MNDFRSLNFCPCTILFLDLDDLVGFRYHGFNPHWGVTFCYWILFFHVAKPLIPILALLPLLCITGKLE